MRRLALIFLLVARPCLATTMTILDADPPGVGLNDPSPRAPEGGNTGTTLGQQRRIAIQYALDTWGSYLVSSVPIVSRVVWQPYPCGSITTLADARPDSVEMNFAGAPLANTWYAAALADSLAGTDLNPGSPDILTTYNSAIDEDCQGTGRRFYYGLDHVLPYNTIDFLLIVTHEAAHGLGFLTLVSLFWPPPVGTLYQGFNDAYTNWIYDPRVGLRWPEMTIPQRIDSAAYNNDTVWIGPHGIAAASVLSAGKDAAGRPRLFTSGGIDPGKSVSHWGFVMSPNELLQPYFQPNTINTITKGAFRDMGWLTVDATPTPTPCVAHPVLDIDNVIGIAGGSVTVGVSLSASNGCVAAASQWYTFDNANLSIDTTTCVDAGGQPIALSTYRLTCTNDHSITCVSDDDCMSPGMCSLFQGVVLTNGLSTLNDGPIFRCTVDIDIGAGVGIYSLVTQLAQTVAPGGAALSTTGIDGAVTLADSTPTNTATNTITSTPTRTPTNTPTQTPTITMTPTISPTSNPLDTPTNTPTITMSPTITGTMTPTDTATQTPTRTPTNTTTETPTPNPTMTTVPTFTEIPTATMAPTLGPSPTQARCVPYSTGQCPVDQICVPAL